MIEQVKFKQDVFISYNQADQGWVDSELLRRLNEAEISYIEERRFRPGVGVVQEITSAIKESRRTLLVITSSYLSDTCEELVNGLAFNYVLRAGQWRIIPALKEECVLPELLSALVAVPLYTSDEEEWRRLTDSLSSSGGASRAPKDQPPQPPEAPTQAIRTHTTQDGWTLFIDAMKDPEVRDSVRAFGVDLQELRGDIADLAGYKKTHDLLQQLEDQYNVIYHSGRGASTGEPNWEGIEAVEPRLQEIASDLLRAARDSSFASDDHLWVKRLNKALVEINRSTNANNSEELRTATRRLKEILDSVPSKINTSMVLAAKELRFGPLEKALTIVHDKLARLDSKGMADRIEKINSSRLDLVELDSKLRACLFVHDSLQEIDGELRRVESRLEGGVSEVADAWQDLKPMTEDLCAGSSSDWAARLLASGGELENALVVLDHIKTKRSFRSYRSQVSRSFNVVDRELLAICNQLEEDVGKQLAPLLAVP